MRSVFGILSALLLSVASVRAQPAPAEPSEQQLALARSLFEEGLDFVSARQWAQAADRFQRVMEIRSSPVVAYNLASALVHLERLLRARALLRSTVLQPEVAGETRRAAEQLLSEIEPRIGRVRLIIRGTKPDTVLLLDDTPLEMGRLSAPLELDPGPHRIAVLVAGQPRSPKAFVVRSRQPVLEVEYDVTPPVPDPQTAAGAAPPPSQPASSVTPTAVAPTGPPADPSSGLGPWGLWTAVAGVAVAGLVVGVVVASDRGEPPPPLAGDTMPGLLRGQVDGVFE